MNRPRAVGLLLAFLALLAFLPATRNGFVNYDDDVYVTQNPVVLQGVTIAGIKWAFNGFHANNWHPFTWVSHMADTTLFRLNPAGHHFVSVLFHAANVFLLFTLLFRLTSALGPAAFAAALFAFHPLHVESVAWVSERKDVLSAFFALLALLCYASFAQKSEARSQRPENPSSAFRLPPSGFWPPASGYWLALLFFVAALLSKPMAVTLPLLMLLLDFWPLGRIQTSKFTIQSWVKPIVEKIPFFILSVIFCVVTFLAQKEHAVASVAGVPVPLRLGNAVAAYIAYLGKTAWPLHLCVFYPLPQKLPLLTGALSAIGLLLVSVAAWGYRANKPYLLTGWLWFLVTLVPVIGLVQVGSQAMADRYSYMPLTGIFVAVSWLAADLVRRVPGLKMPAWIAAVCIVGACLFLTGNQLGYWRDSETLFRHALEVGSDDALVHLNLGSALEDKNDFDGAVTQYRRALELDPSRHEIYNNVGKLLAAQGRFNEALPYCRDAVRLAPSSAISHYGLGVVLRRLGQGEEAMHEFSEAARLDADYAPPLFQMGQVLLRQGRADEALARFRQALGIRPDNFQMLVAVARVEASDDDPRARDGGEALRLARRAMDLDGNALALDALAMASAENQQFDDARRFGKQACDLSVSLPPEESRRIRDHFESFQRNQPWREAWWKN